jgi:hypothetical protein
MEIACHGKHPPRGAHNLHPSTPRRHQISPVHVTMASLYNVSRTSYDDPGGPPPGSPPTCTPLLICLSLSVLLFILSSVKYEGPWLSTQIMISSSIGMVSLLIFSYCRTRWPLLFAPRTKLKGTQLRYLSRVLLRRNLLGFSPHEAHAHGAFFGWILPTLKVSEYSVLQIVGLDAAVVCYVRVGSCVVHYLMSRIALKLFKDVVLSILFMLGICDYDPNAC